MKVNSETIIESLKKVIEPDLGKDIVSLGLVTDIKVMENKVSFSVQMKNAAMHARKRMQQACEFAIERSIGKNYSIEVNVQAMKKAEASQSVLPNIKNTIAVVSGKGGVGKSTVSANLAVGLAKKGFNVGVVDADIYGPSMPIMFDVLHYRPISREINKKQVIVPAENYGVKILSIGFFAELDEAVVWRGPMAVKALKQLIFDADWGELDYLIIDTPPGTGDVHLSIVQSLPLTGAVVVTTPQPVALADAKKAVAMLKMDNIKVPVLGLVENMSWFTPKNHPEEKYFIFGEDGGENLAKSLSLELLGKVPLVESIRQSGDVGRPAVLQQETIVEKYYNDLCDKLILNIEERNAKLDPTKVVGVEYGAPKCST
ncbi:MAG: Mrp/NBP35 family ATP-binding protein [Flavobacteriales bacterium]|nr:Mrp/NBP35 family ATP-binding protein [Flavobacteriales bacterium]MBL6869217.1 Mrp/NBP35 family ATP-binding protein [Flavobacteriales bacterium]MDB2482771.1 Mrp/NBP35 family ATP-binding protein [bacterium]MDC0520746.1 Mrp/NBP35 family ATP-binding protein [Flavobacteriales bacterium]